MRFHHSTRRGRTKFSQGGGPHHRNAGGGPAASNSSISNRWAQLSYCRQTNIHFNRRLPVEVPDSVRLEAAGQWEDTSSVAQEDLLAQQDSGQVTNNQQQIERHMNELRLTGDGDGKGDRRREPSEINSNKGIDINSNLISANREVSEDKEETTKTTKQREREFCGKTKRLKGGMILNGTKKSFKSALSNGRRKSSLCNATESCDSAKSSASSSWPEKRLDIDEAREKLIAQVEKHPFWSNKAAKRMRLLDLIERRIFIYELISHCERRDLEWRYEPYRGGLVTGTGPFVGAGNTGVKRVLSSVSEQLAATGDQQIEPSQELRRNRAPVSPSTSISQPASPMTSPDSNILQAFERSKQEFASENLDKTRTVCDNDRQSSRRQPIRRSCSSAATSPSHGLASQPSFGLTGATNEPRPLPSADFVWSIKPPAHLRPGPFANYCHTTEVPDTSFVKRCHGCQGRGRLKCTSCYGVGYEVCISCSGKGTMKSLSTGASGLSGHNYPSQARHERDSASGATVGSMWGGVEANSDSRLGSGRHDEPGGISSAGAGLSTGSWTSDTCHFCHGAGQKRCWICAGRSYNTCTACAGTGQLRCYLNLNITWLNHRDECVLNNSDAIIPKDRLKLSSGLLLADTTAVRLAPIAPADGRNSSPNLTQAPSSNSQIFAHTTQDGDPGLQGPGLVPPSHQQWQTSPTIENINDSRVQAKQIAGITLDQVVRPNELQQLQAFSSKLLRKHENDFERSERLLRQRHRVTQVECYLVNWEWKRRRGHFVIYGNERKVYIAKYPFKSICNIT